MDNEQDLLDDYIPEQFRVIEKTAVSLHLVIRRQPMNALNLFMLCFNTLWVGVTLVLVARYIRVGVDVEGQTIPLWLVLIFVALSVWLVGYTLSLLFSQTAVQLDAQMLRMQTKLLGVERQSAEVARSQIKRLVQVQDGGEDDSFPTWGLRADTDSGQVKLIYRQPYEVSEWLGKVVAQWANVRFREAGD